MLYYYGHGVEKNLRRANDLFSQMLISGEKPAESDDNLINMSALLLETETDIKISAYRAYSYLNLSAKTGHLAGTHMFAMMNEHGIEGGVKMCSLTIEFFKNVADRSEDSKQKFDLGEDAYKNGSMRTAALLFLELAEEGQNVRI